MDTKKAIRILSLIYTMIAALTVVAALFGIRTTESATVIANSRGAINLEGYDPKVVVAIIYGIEALIYLWYGWLLGRVANGKSNGTFILALGILGVAGGVYSLFAGFNLSTLLSTVTSAAIVFLIFKFRKEKELEEVRAFMAEEAAAEEDKTE